MLKSVEGVYRDGRVELLEAPADAPEGPVIVTFLAGGGPVDLRAVGMTEAESADLRARLSTFAEDWERPEMDVYDAL